MAKSKGVRRIFEAHGVDLHPHHVKVHREKIQSDNSYIAVGYTSLNVNQRSRPTVRKPCPVHIVRMDNLRRRSALSAEIKELLLSIKQLKEYGVVRPGLLSRQSVSRAHFLAKNTDFTWDRALMDKAIAEDLDTCINLITLEVKYLLRVMKGYSNKPR